MSRLAAWWEAFWSSFTWIGKTVEWSEKAGKVIGVLAPIAMASLGIAATATEFAASFAPYAPFLIGGACVYVAWKAGIAWEQTKGPVISIGRIEHDAHYNMFEARVKNAGSGAVLATAFIVDVRDHEGKRIPRIDSEWPLHWRGSQSPEFHLQGERHATLSIAVCAPDPRERKYPCLTILPPGESNYAVLHPLKPTPAGEQKRIQVTIRVDFADTDNRTLLQSKLKSFTIYPPKSSADHQADYTAR